MKTLYALKIEAPQSVGDAVMELLPQDSLSQTAFKKDPDDHSEDPLWVIQGFYAENPDARALSVPLRVLSASQGHKEYSIVVETVLATGWLEKSEENSTPVRAGRIVIHSAKDRAVPPAIGITLPVGAAFGTGRHPTTYGCLIALQEPGLLKRGMRMLDIGTGSGILAFAAAKLKHARVMAGEMDGESVLVARENIRRNGLLGRVNVEHAEGFRHQAIARHRYPLIVSNIFARPLARLAPAMRRHLRPGGHIILAGFLERDANLVQSAYAAQRIHVKKRLRFGEWVILILRRPSAAPRMLRKSR